MIYILSGAIRTGKTSRLLDWISGRNDVDGLLCPDDVHGKRYFLKVKSQEAFQLEIEAEIENEKVISIGPFRFLKSAFEDANNFLLSSSSEKNHRYLIIDELGKLELKKRGLHQAAEILIPDYMFSDKHHLILVVRASLVEEITEHYDISNYSVLGKEDLDKLD